MPGPFKTQNAAVTTAFFVVPVVPSFFIQLIGGWTFSTSDVMGPLLTYVIALPCCFVLGLPLFLLFSRFRMFSWWGSLLGGCLGGVAILALVGTRNDLFGAPLVLFGAVGAATGLAFWVVVMLGPEPNQSTAKNWVEPFRRRRL